MKTADAFTFARIILAPVIFFLYYIPLVIHDFYALSVILIIPLFIFAELTDFFDGFFARKLNQVSDFGKLFDPFADVLLHMTLFICFVFSGYMPIWIFLFILYREFGMLFIRLLAAKKGVAIGARKGGKAKTVLYVVAASFSLLCESALRLYIYDSEAVMFYARTIGITLYILAFAASYASFIDYIRYAIPILNKKE